MTLNEKDGSSRQKIARYIENEFNVPKSTLHEVELTSNLRHMKSYGQLVLVRHSYKLPDAPPPPPPPPLLPQYQPQSSLGPYVGPSVPPTVQPPVGSAVQPSVGATVAPNPVPDVHKRKPGRPPKLQIVSPTQTPSPPVGFAAFSPKSGVPTTSLFGGLTPASHQFSAGPSVSTMGLVTGSSNYASTMVPVSGSAANGVPTMTIASGPVTIVPSMGPVSNVPLTSPVNNVHAFGGASGSVNNVPLTGSGNNILAMGLVSGPASNVSLTYPVTGPMANLPGLVGVSVSNVSSTSPIRAPVFDPVVLPKMGPSEQNNESAGVVGTGLESSAGPLVVSAANDPVVPQNNDGPLLVVSTGTVSIAPNNDGPSMVFAKRGRGRPPKISGGIKKLWGKPTSYGRRGRRGRPKKVAFPVSTFPVSTISLRPRGRPRKNAEAGAIVAVDGANGGGGDGALPVANIPLELPDRSFGRPNKVH